MNTEYASTKMTVDRHGRRPRKLDDDDDSDTEVEEPPSKKPGGVVRATRAAVEAVVMKQKAELEDLCRRNACSSYPHPTEPGSTTYVFSHALYPRRSVSVTFRSVPLVPLCAQSTRSPTAPRAPGRQQLRCSHCVFFAAACKGLQCHWFYTFGPTPWEYLPIQTFYMPLYCRPYRIFEDTEEEFRRTGAAGLAMRVRVIVAAYLARNPLIGVADLEPSLTACFEGHTPNLTPRKNAHPRGQSAGTTA